MCRSYLAPSNALVALMRPRRQFLTIGFSSARGLGDAENLGSLSVIAS
jgi:hypothetical protein